MDSRLSYHFTFVRLNSFQLTLGDNPRLQHTKEFNSTLENRDGLFFLQAEITTLPRGTELQIHSTQQGQIGMIAPTTTRTPQGPADTGSAGDYWQFNKQGELVRVQRQYRKTLFTPSRTQRPVPAEQLEDYRRIRSKDGTTNTFEDKYQTTDAANKAQQQMWKGETAFRIKKGPATPETLQQKFATETQPRSTPQKVTPQAKQYNPRTRLREKTTPPTTQIQQHHTPPKVQAHTGRKYTSSHTHRFYTPEQTHDGPDIKRLTPCRYNRQEDSTTQDW